jgi:hypothetical protein
LRRAIIVLIILFTCLLWLGSPSASPARPWPVERRGQGREPVVNIAISSSGIALTWGMPAALIYQMRALHPRS